MIHTANKPLNFKFSNNICYGQLNNFLIHFIILICDNNIYINNCLTGNRLICDCRLSWLHKLRNETRSKRVKASLDRLSCVMDNKLKTNLVNMKAQSYDGELKINSGYKTEAEKSEDGEEEFDDDNVYDDAMKDQDIGFDVSKKDYRRKLMEIPVDMLPCASKLSYEASFSPPTQDEVKYYKTSGCDKCSASITFIALCTLTRIL